ncbi:MAG: TonB-dependent receptor [Nitrospirota bacterium]
MYFKEEELIVESPTRSPKPISQTAENVTVITAEAIELMNAHTLGEVLNTIPGVQVFTTGAPGSSAPVHIQGSEQRHVTVFLDGVNMGLVSDNVADTGAIPVQHIERIEIIKGPASSAWGSSLGGIINVITKSPKSDRALSGTLSGSYGERETMDYRAELSGTSGKAGYYLYAGRLSSDGFRANNDIANNHIYTKLTYDIERHTAVTFTLGYDKGDRGETEFGGVEVDNDFRNLFSTLSFHHAFNDETNMLVSLRASRLVFNRFSDSREDNYRDKGYGASIKLTWKPDSHNVVVGMDFDDRTLKSNTVAGGEQELEKWALFANDTITWGRLSLTPGVRYDHTNTNGDFFSPSLGLTYSLMKKTLLRAYVARGFHIPPLSYTYANTSFFTPNPDLEVEKVWSYQVGAETVLLDSMWVKLSLFRHDIKDFITGQSIAPSLFTYKNSERRRRQGVEFEVKTVPVYNTSLSAGFTFIASEDRDTGETVRNTPRYTYDFSVQYDDKKSITAFMKGHYIWWDSAGVATPSGPVIGNYSSFIVDLTVTKILYRREDQSAELFASANNIFNGSQYFIGFYKNPGRWFEGGIRYKF